MVFWLPKEEVIPEYSNSYANLVRLFIASCAVLPLAQDLFTF